MSDEASRMRREIEEIPEAVRRLLDRGEATLADAGATLRALDPRVVTTVARGSSDHAATFLKYAVELAARVPVASLGPSVASVYGVRLKLEGSACLAISQSGRSPDIVAMAEAAREGGALTLALVNDAGAPLANACRHAIDIMAGPEKSVAATKSFVASAVAGLAILAHWKQDEALLSALHRLPDRLADAIGCDWSPVADALPRHESIFVLGRGPSSGMAGEAALKLKETCAIHAEAYSAAELMHGPLALVGRGFPVLVLASRDAAETGVVDAADAIARDGAAVFVTSDRARHARRLPYVATDHPLCDPLPLIVSFYAFAERLARARGRDPDRPERLSKVTETL